MAYDALMAEDTSRLLLRLPKPLHDALTEMARREHRSLNAQILHLLQQAVDQHSR